jgi:hypothetical protein
MELASLQNGELEIIGRITDASNATLLAQIAEHRVVYKPIAGERPLWDFPDGNLAQREFSAFLVSDFLGFDVVPNTVLRDGPYGIGMVQEWIDPNETIDVVQFAQTQSKKIRQMALFDALINNGDRKFGHILPVSEDIVYGCDHGVTFNRENKLRTVLWQWAGREFDANEIAAIELFIQKFDSKQFSDLLTSEEIDATLKRAEDLLIGQLFPEPSPDWPAIPWPPF